MSIVDVLTAGTARRDATPRVPDGLAQEILAAPVAPDGSPELRLLYAAGAQALARKAGLVARSDLPAPIPADRDLLPECRPRAATLIREMLCGAHDALLPEALERLLHARVRLPHALLPLALIVRRAEVRARVVPLLGPRGRWLAAQHPAFAWACEAPPAFETLARTWTEGTSAPRRDALDRARRLDPAAARGWLASTWASEKAEDRAVFLAVMQAGLSPADEPFLEAALDDRSSRVRAVATGLLAQLPTSAFVARMRARADAMLEKKGAALRVIDPTPEPRDGLPEGADLRAMRVTAVLAAASLDAQERRLAATPDELVALAQRTTDTSALADGWSRAALRARDARWAVALWDLWAHADDKLVDRSLASEHMQALLAVLPPAVAVARVAMLLDRPGAQAQRPLGAFLVGLASPWPTALTERYLMAILRAQGAVSPRASELMSALNHAVRAIAEPDLARVQAALPPEGGDGPWRHSIAEALDLITIRREILEETRP